MEYDYEFEQFGRSEQSEQSDRFGRSEQFESESRHGRPTGRQPRQDEPEEASVPDLAPITQIFRDQLMACLEECSAGRLGLFATSDYLGEAARHRPWPEAERLRELAMNLQPILAQASEPDVAVEQFLDLCSMHGESDPGEPRLARAFLEELAGRRSLT